MKNDQVYNQYFYSPEISQSTKPKPILTKKDAAFTFVFFAISFIIVDFVFNMDFSFFNIGCMMIFVLLFAVSTAYLFTKLAKFSLFGYTCGALSLMGSATFAFNSDLFVNAIMVFLVMSLFTVYVCCLSNTFVHNQGSIKILIDMLKGVFITPYEQGSLIKDAYAGSYKKSRSIKNVAVGVAISLPVLLVIIPLLTSSDAAFEGLITLIFKNAGRYIAELFVSILVFVIILLYFVSKAKRLGIDNNANSRSKHNGVVPVSVAVPFLSVISLTYIVYLFSQLAYFFSAFSGILPKGYTFSASEYARRGFFEMFAICVVNMIIVAFASLLTKKIKGKMSLPVKLLSLFVLLFSVLLIIIAMAKMKLNIETYALSKNRVMVSVFMLMLLIIIAFYILHLFAAKINYMQPIIVICSALFIALAFSNVDYQIAKYNLDAYNNQKIDSLDVYNISEMSNSVVPILIDLADNDNHFISKEAKTAVLKRIEREFDVSFNINNSEYFPEVKYSPESIIKFNKSDNTAKRALADYYNSLDNKQKENLITQYSFDSEVNDYIYDAEKDEYYSVSGNKNHRYAYNEKDDRYEFVGVSTLSEDDL